MKSHKYALGLWEMLQYAIHGHRKKHYGEYPKRIEMHPANLAELRSDKRFMHSVPTYDCSGSFPFMGTQIVEDVKAARLKMITVNNEVEYL